MYNCLDLTNIGLSDPTLGSNIPPGFKLFSLVLHRTSLCIVDIGPNSRKLFYKLVKFAINFPVFMLSLARVTDEKGHAFTKFNAKQSQLQFQCTSNQLYLSILAALKIHVWQCMKWYMHKSRSHIQFCDWFSVLESLQLPCLETEHTTDNSISGKWSINNLAIILHSKCSFIFNNSWFPYQLYFSLITESQTQCSQSTHTFDERLWLYNIHWCYQMHAWNNA